ncbi:helix-turn-helix domain-containing protein [Desulfomonile tiedjei]|uniref:Helix-turn-helix domain-containing protein n=1 Tax=Desulfomonile tiedjei (strain ATCC 49306 / DSM 6799 / DCB-1) TaxID=706587 RepID=I4CE32_DESTA|nr:hypothetical protein Desti_5226 [Desulfomonile tiedjei DSM 6799]
MNHLNESATEGPFEHSTDELTNSTNPIPQLLTPKEAATLLRISIKALNALAHAGKIGYVWKNNRERGYFHEHLRQYLAAREVVATLSCARKRGPVVPVEPCKSVDNRVSESLRFRPKGGGDSRTRRESERGKVFRAQLREEMCKW